MKNFYYILGTEINCTASELTEAYKKLTKKFHPDLNQNDNYFTERFKEISEAYETLIDPARRKRYDASLKQNGLYPLVKAPKQTFNLRPKNTDRIFTLMLLLITVVFGYYVYRSISGTKTIKANTTAIATHTTKHHKKKTAKAGITPIKAITPANRYAKTIKDTVSDKAPRPVQAVNKKPVNISTVPVVNTAGLNTGVLYAVSIKSNVTGVVDMRQSANYGSAIIKVVPAGSKVFVIEKGDIFYKISSDNIIGYVPKWTVK